MYPVKLGYDEAISRIKGLLRNGFEAEAFVTTVFTVEKTFYRVLRQLVISAGFSSLQTSKLLQGFRGIENIKRYWECFDPNNKKLSEIIKQKDIKIISDAQTVRNDIVHGKRVFTKKAYRENIELLLPTLETIRHTLEQKYGFDGWSKIRGRRISTLHQLDPKVKI